MTRSMRHWHATISPTRALAAVGRVESGGGSDMGSEGGALSVNEQELERGDEAWRSGDPGTWPPGCGSLRFGNGCESYVGPLRARILHRRSARDDRDRWGTLRCGRTWGLHENGAAKGSAPCKRLLLCAVPSVHRLAGAARRRERLRLRIERQPTRDVAQRIVLGTVSVLARHVADGWKRRCFRSLRQQCGGASLVAAAGVEAVAPLRTLNFSLGSA